VGHLFRTTCALILGIGLRSGIARADDVNTVIQGIESTYGEVNSLQANFVQINRSSAMGEVKLRGRVELERPRKMRWSFTQPPGKLFVTDGTTMWVWSKSDNQVVISTGVGQGGGNMTQLLDDLNKLGELFTVELMSSAAGPEQRSYVLSLTPKQENSVQRIELRVSRKHFSVEKVKTIDGFGNEVELSFSHVKTNIEIPDSRFSFDVPSGAEVVRTDGP